MRRWLEFFRHHASQELQQFIDAQPDGSRLATDSDFVVFDIETTGLNTKRDHIISLGAVRISKQTIRPSVVLEQLWQSPASVGDSALVHGLTDEMLAAGLPAYDALLEFFQFAEGAQLVAHHATIEQLFLSRACLEYHGKAFVAPFVDTLALEKYLVTQRHSMLKNDEYQLSACLARNHLPSITPHQAFADAFGTAYLLLAQLQQFAPDLTLQRLRQLSR